MSNEGNLKKKKKYSIDKHFSLTLLLLTTFRLHPRVARRMAPVPELPGGPGAEPPPAPACPSASKVTVRSLGFQKCRCWRGCQRVGPAPRPGCILHAGPWMGKQLPGLPPRGSPCCCRRHPGDAALGRGDAAGQGCCAPKLPIISARLELPSMSRGLTWCHDRVQVVISLGAFRAPLGVSLSKALCRCSASRYPPAHPDGHRLLPLHLHMNAYLVFVAPANNQPHTNTYIISAARAVVTFVRDLPSMTN